MNERLDQLVKIGLSQAALLGIIASVLAARYMQDGEVKDNTIKNINDVLLELENIEV